MQPGWRVLTKTIVFTAALTTAFWFAVAAWWFQRAAPAAQSSAMAEAPRQALVAPASAAPGPDGPLAMPVQGVRPQQLADTFTQARASGGRHHDAIDIMAPRGTPVVAAAAGKVEKLFLSNDGGKTVYVRSSDGWRIYYYAHLDSYAPDLREGSMIRRGSPLGTVGSTGNANPAAPHLHFAVWETTPQRKWWEQVTAINPFPLLRSP